MSGVAPPPVDELPDGWSIRPFGSLTSWMSGGTPSKSNPEFWGGAAPWISAKSLKSFYLYDSEDHVTEAAVADGARLAAVGDVLMLVRGMTLHNDVPVGVAMRPMAFNQDVKGLRGKRGADTRFISYWLAGNKWKLLAAVDEASHGTGRLRTEVVQAMDVALPSPSEQRAIASVLGALDDKIEQNRRTAQ
ncbi:MAG: restriction endonuclease subunit S, partial [Proteobacteria bacterium]|nr:restriction endonuclease subunit S [Pseudomonadota bacterium]